MSAATGQSAINSKFKVFSKSYVFDPRPHFPFRISASRYWTNSDSDSDADAGTSLDLDDGKMQRDALTLTFAHANGFHKEHWEPIIHRPFEQQQVVGRCSLPGSRICGPSTHRITGMQQ